MNIAGLNLNLNDSKDAKKYFQLLLIAKYEKFPFFSNLLLNLADIEDVHPEQRDKALAYTYFDHTLERIKIRVNYDWLENGVPTQGDNPTFLGEIPAYQLVSMVRTIKRIGSKESDLEIAKELLKKVGAGPFTDNEIDKAMKSVEITRFTNDNALYLVYHELLHNYFHHFSRHEKYRKDYAKLANIVEDYYINEFLDRLFKCINNFGDMPKGFEPYRHKELNEFAKRNCGRDLPFSNYDEKPIESQVIEWFLQFKDQWKDDMNGNNKGANSNSGSGSGSNSDKGGPGGENGTGDHSLSEEYSERTLEGLNKSRKKEGKSEVSIEEANSLASKKIDENANMAKEMAGDSISQGENDCLRHKDKILKKDPFLNYVKITNTLKKMMIKGTYKNYAKPNRKRNGGEMVYKCKNKEEGLHIVVGVDVSGSVSDKELKKIYDMLGTFLEKNNKETSIDIFYWSSCRLKDKVHFHSDIRDSRDLLSLKIHSSGGTILQTAHDFLDEKYAGKKIQFLNITDGYFENATLPNCVTDYYFCLTEKGMFEDIQKWYPKAKIRVCRVSGD
ncbi:MAG: hypothetical protein ACRCSY_07560 [Cetobacterium sp.]